MDMVFSIFYIMDKIKVEIYSWFIIYFYIFSLDIKFEELQEKVKNKEVFVIDARTPPEANERGIIPGAVNIPSKFIGLYNLRRINLNFYHSEQAT